jgi:hypothetical protein
MDADDMLKDACYEAACETLADPRIDPDEEEERIGNLARNYYRGCLQDLRDREDENNETDEWTDYLNRHIAQYGHEM